MNRVRGSASRGVVQTTPYGPRDSARRTTSQIKAPRLRPPPQIDRQALAEMMPTKSGMLDVLEGSASGCIITDTESNRLPITQSLMRNENVSSVNQRMLINWGELMQQRWRLDCPAMNTLINGAFSRALAGSSEMDDDIPSSAILVKQNLLDHAVKILRDLQAAMLCADRLRRMESTRHDLETENQKLLETLTEARTRKKLVEMQEQRAAEILQKKSVTILDDTIAKEITKLEGVNEEIKIRKELLEDRLNQCYKMNEAIQNLVEALKSTNKEVDSRLDDLARLRSRRMSESKE